MTLDLRGICPLIQVFDMPASLAFYRDTLGFELIGMAPENATNDDYGWAWLRHGSTELMLNTLYDPDDERPAAADPARTAAHGDTCLYIGCPSVDSAYEYLQKLGVNLPPPVTAYYGMRQLHLTDPDGFGICFQSKTVKTERAGKIKGAATERPQEPEARLGREEGGGRADQS